MNEACLFETKALRDKTILIIQQIFPSYYDKIKEIFKLENPVFRVSNCMLYIWQVLITLDSRGSRGEDYFLLSKQCCSNQTKQMFYYYKILPAHFAWKKTETEICERTN